MNQEPAKVLCVPSFLPILNGAPPGTTHPSGESSSRSKRFTANKSARSTIAARNSRLSDWEADLVGWGLMPKHLLPPVLEEDPVHRSVRQQTDREPVGVGVPGVAMLPAKNRSP